jgi:hypothetical protein
MRNPSSPTMGRVVENPAVVGAVPGATQQRNGVAFDGMLLCPISPFPFV